MIDEAFEQPSLKPYQTYKDSGVPWLGDIPSHWEVLPGFSAYRQKQDKNTGLVEKAVLSLSYGRIIIKPPEKLHGLVPASFETYQIINPGDIIIRPTDLQNDKVSLRVGIARHRGIITSAYLCLKTTELLTPDYGYLLLHAYDLLKVFYGIGSGLRQNLDYTDIKRMPVLVPPKEDQIAITNFLSKLDRSLTRLIRAKRRLIELLNEQKQAIIQRAVTRGLDPDVPLKPSGVEWLGDIPEHWEVYPGKACFREKKIPNTGLKVTKVLSLSYGRIIVKPENKLHGLVPASFETYQIIEKDDIIVRPTDLQNDHTSLRFGLCEETGIITSAYMCLNTNDLLTSEYGYLLLHSYDLIKIIYGLGSGLRQNLRWEDFKYLPCLVPPLSEQISIARHIKASNTHLERQLDKYRKEINLLVEYRTRLIADVVTGKLDVRRVELPALDEMDFIEEVDTSEEDGSRIDEDLEEMTDAAD